jgi:TonB family protein
MGSTRKGKDGKPLKPKNNDLIRPHSTQNKIINPEPQKNIRSSSVKSLNDKFLKKQPLFNPLDYYSLSKPRKMIPAYPDSSSTTKSDNKFSRVNFDRSDFSDFIPSNKDFGQGDGKLATGGNAVFNSHGYDITPWAKRVVYRIKKNWNIPASVNLGLYGIVNIYAVIEKHGNLALLIVKKSSNIKSFDKAAFSAIKISAPFPQLPDDFPYNQIEGMIIFRYN